MKYGIKYGEKYQSTLINRITDPPLVQGARRPGR